MSMRQTVSEKRWPEVIRAAIRLAEEKVLGKLPEKDERVVDLHEQIQNPSKLDVGVERNKDRKLVLVANPTDAQKRNREQAERDCETLRRDFRHWGINASFSKNVGGVSRDLSGAAMALAFSGFDAQLVNAVRRLVVLTGIQPEWVTKAVGPEGLYLEDQDRKPTVAAIMAPAKAKLAEMLTEPDPADEQFVEDDIVARLCFESTRDVERKALVAAKKRDQDAFDFVEKWLLAGGRPQGKPVASTPKPTLDRNTAAVAKANELAAAGRGTVSAESLPVSAIADATNVLEIEPMAVNDEPTPTLEEQVIAVEARIAEAVAGRQFVQAAELDMELTKLHEAIDERERQAEATQVATESEAEEHLELVVEEVPPATQAAVAVARAPAPATDELEADFAKIFDISEGDDTDKATRAAKLVQSVKDGKRSMADAVEMAKLIRLIK